MENLIITKFNQIEKDVIKHKPLNIELAEEKLKYLIEKVNEQYLAFGIFKDYEGALTASENFKIQYYTYQEIQKVANDYDQEYNELLKIQESFITEEARKGYNDIVCLDQLKEDRNYFMKSAENAQRKMEEHLNDQMKYTKKAKVTQTSLKNKIKLKLMLFRILKFLLKFVFLSISFLFAWVMKGQEDKIDKNFLESNSVLIFSIFFLLDSVFDFGSDFIQEKIRKDVVLGEFYDLKKEFLHSLDTFKKENGLS